MTPADKRRRAIQERILDQVKSISGATDAEVAGWAGVERSLVSRWRYGTREIGLLDLLGMVRGCGDAVPVLQPIADAGDCDVRRREADGVTDLMAGALELGMRTAALASEVHAAMADGVLSGAERDQLRASAASLRELAERIEAGVR
jgi:hypothetical protein